MEELKDDKNLIKENTKISGEKLPAQPVPAEASAVKNDVTSSDKSLGKLPKIPKKKKSKDFTPNDLADLNEKLDRKESGFLNISSKKRFVKKIIRGIIVKRLILLSLILILFTIGILYLFSYTYINSSYGINIVASQTNDKAISLSDDSSFDRLSVGLKATAINAMDNITYDWIPNDLDDSVGGSNNGENYIAYTFYVLNTGKVALDYNSVLSVKYSTRNVETAIRVEVFKNGVPTIYTYSYEDQIDGIFVNDEGIAVEQFDTTQVVNDEVILLDVGTYDKYTIIIWLEGEDNDCVNDKHLAELQLSWFFNVIE